MTGAASLYFDFVDPVSFLLERELTRTEGGDEVVRRPFELRPPPTPLTGLDDPEVEERWGRARPLADAEGLLLSPPALVPWTRKAHELHRLAGEDDPSDRAGGVRSAIFDAYMVEGRDIGRVDVLVEIAASCGIDRTLAKATLDVDRYESDIAAERAAAVDLGVTGPATLVLGRETLRGFHNASTLSTFLRR